MYQVCFTSGTRRATVNRHEHHMILKLYWETLVYVNKHKYNKKNMNLLKIRKILVVAYNLHVLHDKFTTSIFQDKIDILHPIFVSRYRSYGYFNNYISFFLFLQKLIFYNFFTSACGNYSAIVLISPSVIMLFKTHYVSLKYFQYPAY